MGRGARPRIAQPHPYQRLGEQQDPRGGRSRDLSARSSSLRWTWGISSVDRAQLPSTSTLAYRLAKLRSTGVYPVASVLVD
ncbi:MAG: hypothetical protein H7274_12850 [Rhodoferax sp.]|nr:hypothetical protein [Rhodoferax sp.]